MTIKIKGHFRPKLLVMTPIIMLAIKPPTTVSDAIHPASSIDILPDGNGDSSEVRIMIHKVPKPAPIPFANANKFTNFKSRQ